MSRPIFLTGLARGGTNLLARMLIAGGDCRIAIHAFQPWFKSLRNAIVAHCGAPGLRQGFDPASPFGDGYYNDRELAVQRVLHAAYLDVPFNGEEWPSLHESLLTRAADEAADLCPRLAALSGARDYADMLDRILDVIADGHGAGLEYVGLIDTWIIDLLPALARSCPDARFVVAIRDPRAIAASMLKFLDSAPETVGHILSVLRQWRKFVTLAYEFGHSPPMAGRLKLVRYEDQVRNPERFANQLCGFLKIPYRPAMIDFAQYADPATGRTWSGNSSFTAQIHRIDSAVAERWRTSLAPEVAAAIEFFCRADMEACGYEPTTSPPPDQSSDPRPLNFLIEDGRRRCAWRTDSGDPQTEYERELSRHRALVGSVVPDCQETQRAFLSPAYFDLLKAKGRLFA